VSQPGCVLRVPLQDSFSVHIETAGSSEILALLCRNTWRHIIEKNNPKYITLVSLIRKSFKEKQNWDQKGIEHNQSANQSINQSLYLYIYIFIFIYLYLSINLYLFIYLHLFFDQSIIHPSNHPSVRPSVSLFMYIFFFFTVCVLYMYIIQGDVLRRCCFQLTNIVVRYSLGDAYSRSSHVELHVCVLVI
jgi:hypothetical protein